MRKDSHDLFPGLCLPKDPPRSVAICPSSVYVAFGCSAGIELHYVDQISGKNLMRWFPLTDPSDVLYFLPSLQPFAPPNKLRLLSSRSEPRKCAWDRDFEKSEKSRLIPCLEKCYEKESDRKRDSMCLAALSPQVDHYGAMPLSDGRHVLFVDPPSGTLCLGTEGPTHQPGKLLRKILFDPPECISCRNTPPTIYRAGRNLTWGVRVVAIYGSALVLYSLPPDTFADMMHIERAHPATKRYKPGWPIHIGGVTFADVDGVIDLAVQTELDLAIWVFSEDSLIRTYQISDGTQDTPIQRAIDKNGAVLDMTDDQGDYMMQDAEMDIAAFTSLDGFHDTKALRHHHLGIEDELGHNADDEILPSPSTLQAPVIQLPQTEPTQHNQMNSRAATKRLEQSILHRTQMSASHTSNLLKPLNSTYWDWEAPRRTVSGRWSIVDADGNEKTLDIVLSCTNTKFQPRN